MHTPIYVQELGVANLIVFFCRMWSLFTNPVTNVLGYMYSVATVPYS